eukprot:tig00000403_g343.t1
MAINAPSRSTSTLDPILVLEWTTEDTLKWFGKWSKFDLQPEDPVFRVLGRLALTGPTLLLLPASELRARLPEKLQEEVPNAGKRERDRLDVILASLDRMVGLLVKSALKGCGPDQTEAREEIEGLFRARLEEIDKLKNTGV